MSPAASVSGVASSTTSPPSNALPADRAEASARTRPYPRSRRSLSVTPPPAPVAPTTAIRGSGTDALLRIAAEAIVHRLHGTIDLGRPYDARDTDRRGRDDLDVDAGLAQRLEHVRGDAWMALHSGTDEGHLRDDRVVDETLRGDLRREDLENRLRRGEVRLRKRERDVARAFRRDVS